ncbi:MAG: Gfo/Idh/MocA family oxidoreductase [Dictyoglomaceae bacterium]|nr:Gfo/Idh/MocA family oxidoreductase [Dictyoglomaceae bacterium]
MRWGIIGIGKIVRNRFLPALDDVPDAQITALVTTHPENVRDISEKYGAKIYTRVEDLKDVDVVYIATPNKFHKEQSIICARKGIHIFCEKPIAMNVRETEEMIEECEKNHVVLGIAYMGRFNPFNVGAKKLLEQNILGRIGVVKATYSFVNTERGAWRYNLDLAGGGAIMDIGVHVINTVHFFRPKNRIIELSAINENYEYDVDQNAGAVARFDDGTLLFIDVSYDTSLSVSFEIRGRDGILYVLGTLYQEYDGKVILRKENNFTLYNFHGPNQYVGEILDMEEAIIGKRKPATDGYDALMDMKVVEAWYKSAASKKLVEVSY